MNVQAAVDVRAVVALHAVTQIDVRVRQPAVELRRLQSLFGFTQSQHGFLHVATFLERFFQECLESDFRHDVFGRWCAQADFVRREAERVEQTQSCKLEGVFGGHRAHLGVLERLLAAEELFACDLVVGLLLVGDFQSCFAQTFVAFGKLEVGHGNACRKVLVARVNHQVFACVVAVKGGALQGQFGTAGLNLCVRPGKHVDRSIRGKIRIAGDCSRL